MIGLIGQSLLAVLAGALLNLTPCVLPVIPFKIRAILNETGAESRQRLLAAIAFLCGSLAFFLALGAATAFLQLTWGTLFQSVLFRTLIVALLFLAGVFTFFNLSFPMPQRLFTLRGKRYVEPFLIGALGGVLSTPCTGPFLGGVLLFAVAQTPFFTLWIFALIGFGLAFPYVALLLRPGLLGRFSPDGATAVRAKETLAFILWAGAVFFAQSLVSSPWVRSLWLLWGLGLALWGLTAFVKGTTAGSRLLPPVLAVLGILGMASTWGTAQPQTLPWEPFSPSRFEALQQSDRPVLIEFTAEWCINCKVLEKTVYADPQVVSAARRVNLAALRVDLTKSDEALENLLLWYGGAGLPFAVVLDPQGRVVQRLPDLFTAGSLLKAVRSASSP